MGNKKSALKIKQKWYHKDITKDIRYRGPLSYRHLKMLGWLCMAVGQVGILLFLAIKYGPPEFDKLASVQNTAAIIGNMSLVFFLIGNFAIILDDSDGYKRVLIANGSATAIIIGVFYIFYFRYSMGVVEAFMGNREEAAQAIHSMLSTSKGFFEFNLFIDLFLCTLIMFFLNFKPRKLFQGKKIYIFRALVVLPVIYEIVSIVLKYECTMGDDVLPTVLYPFLTTKPPMTFVLFLILAIYIKTAEWRFCRSGRTHAEYRQFQQTRRNSWHFSVFAAVMMLLCAAVDFGITTFAGALYIWENFGIETAAAVEEAVYTGSVQSIFSNISDVGFGESLTLIPMAPIMLLFSYTRTYKNKFVDVIIPVGGMLLIVLIYLEGIFQFARRLPGILLGL